jgi:hypothetical protein
VIVEQIHFINIEKSSIGAGEQAGLERFSALYERSFDIKRAADSILRSPERKINNRHRAALNRQAT